MSTVADSGNAYLILVDSPRNATDDVRPVSVSSSSPSGGGAPVAFIPAPPSPPSQPQSQPLPSPEPAESFFRRTWFLITLITLNLSYMISISIALGITIERQHNTLDVLTPAVNVLFAALRLVFEVRALYQNGMTERGSELLFWYCFLSTILLWNGAVLEHWRDSDLFLVVMYWISVGVNCGTWVFSAGYIWVLVNCNTGNPEHNRSIRIGCRRLCR